MHRRHQLALALGEQALLQRSAGLRDALGRQSQTLKAPLALLDQLRVVIDWLGRHPVLPLLMLALLKLKRPQRALDSLSRLYALSQLLLRAWRWIGRPSPRRP
ncbi:MAG: YqjK family protein [Hylemonella sp.]|uniref:YqjK family protein n=1 Tax=Hylemonella sp. TaxID=2066020 RepID=UPI0022CAB3C3|nr:YqjK family protein [Hylemonella sp.]MCZ8252346.1 YqjK family protein [Hylemonella sp.]